MAEAEQPPEEVRLTFKAQRITATELDGRKRKPSLELVASDDDTATTIITRTGRGGRSLRVVEAPLDTVIDAITGTEPNGNAKELAERVVKMAKALVDGGAP